MPLSLHELAAVQGSLKLHGSCAQVTTATIRRLVEDAFTLRELAAACLHENWEDDPAQVALRAHLFPPLELPPAPAPPLDGRLQIAHVLALTDRPLTVQDLERILRRDPRPELLWMERHGQIQAKGMEAWTLCSPPCG